MKRTAIAALLAACGGGPSVENGGNPTTQIISSNCQLIGTTVTVDIAYDTTLGVGQAWESEVLVLDGASFGPQTGESSFVTCGFWSELGSGPGTNGCVRNLPDDPATQDVRHMFSASFENEIFPPLDVMIFAMTFDSPGGFSIGSGANDQITCF